MSHTQKIIGNNNEARQTINQGSRTNNFNGQVGTVIGDGNVGSVSNPQYNYHEGNRSNIYQGPVGTVIGDANAGTVTNPQCNKQKEDKGLYILDNF